MKILMVAIPNHHFFQWVNQLKGSGYEVIWFDVTDGGPKVSRIDWVKQIKGWKLRWDFPLRVRIKNKLPILYRFIQKFNERNVSDVFSKLMQDFKPDIVHCFEMKLSGLPILSVMENKRHIPFIYSSWGSDMFYFKEMEISGSKVEQFFNRVDHLITDCKRDYTIASQNGFKTNFIGVYPGNGGVEIDETAIKASDNRNVISIKGYEDGVGKALLVLKALELISKSVLKSYQVVIYSADELVKKYIEESNYFSDLKVLVYTKSSFLPNEELLQIMGKSCIHIANSISDGMPNALLEAMGMGAFPIQSNPGGVTEEVIENEINGYLISDPLDINNIATLIEEAINNRDLREKALRYNVDFIKNKYNRNSLKTKIVDIYKTIKSEK